MLYSDFKEMELSDQALIICQKGMCAGERMKDNFLIVLYQVNDFYAEVYYSLSSAQLLKLFVFDDTIFLEPYLERININCLFTDLNLESNKIFK